MFNIQTAEKYLKMAVFLDFRSQTSDSVLTIIPSQDTLMPGDCY